MSRRDVLLKILDLARWAPSGDNTQPWAFELVGDDRIVVHGHDTRDWCLYDFDGHASHMAHGALLESIRIAATGFGLSAQWQLRDGGECRNPVFDVTFLECADGLDGLFPYLETRVVQRRPMSMAPMTGSQFEALKAAVGDEFELQLFESFSDRLRVASLLWRSAYVRLTCPEAFSVHREIIEWGARYSADRIPEEAVGVDPMTAKLMKWAMNSWRRVEFLNRYLLGTIPPRIQLDVIPGVACAGHILMRSSKPVVSISDYVAVGVRMQRLWLAATSQGLHLQPEMTPVIFRWYARAGRSMSALQDIDRANALVAEHFERLAGAGPRDAFAFFCRIGRSQVPGARSVRKPLDELFVETDSLRG